MSNTMMSIEYAKANADDEAYANIFLDKLNYKEFGKKLCMFCVGNTSVLRILMDALEPSETIIYDSEQVVIELSSLKVMSPYLSKYNIKLHTCDDKMYENFSDGKVEVVSVNYTFMNPPWGDGNNVGLGQKILRTFLPHTDECVCLYGENEFYGVHSNNRNRMQEYQHCNAVSRYSSNKEFNIDCRMNFVVSTFDTSKTFESVKFIDNVRPEWSGTYSWGEIGKHMIRTKDFVKLFDATKSVYDTLIKNSLKNGMCNLSNDQFEYFENKLKKNNHSNDDVANSEYKFILNHTSYEHIQDPIYDNVENQGGITWTCKTERIKHNMYYWLHDCPLSFLWRKYFLNDSTAHGCSYSCLPTLNFDMDENEFKSMVNSIIPGFNETNTIESICELMKK